MRASRILLPPGDRESARDLVRLLQEDYKLDDVRYEDAGGSGLTPDETVVLVVFGLPLGAGVVTRVIDWLRGRRACLLVVDVRDGRLDIEQRCDLPEHRGKTIVVTSDDERVEISGSAGAIDIEEIVRIAARDGARSALEQARAAGHDARLTRSDQSPV